MSLPHSADIVIVGAGPTGLALANTLALAGVDFVILDQLPQGQNTSRAAVIHAHTLEVLNAIGVTDDLVEKGLKISRFAIRDRDRVLLQTRFDTLPTSHPYLLMLPQNVTEQVLADRLSTTGNNVFRGYQVERVDLDQSGARVIASSESSTHTVDTRYVVGADGMHSTVRDMADISFAGASYEESFVLADVSMEWAHGRDEVSLFFSPAGLVVVAPLPSGAFRIVATMTDAPEAPVASDIQALLDARGPIKGVAKVLDIVWSSRFRVHHRIAKAYRQGRLLLAGDAAHVHSPAGGQGMNAGLVDASVLGQILGDVVRHRRNPSILDEYEKLRRPAAEEVLRIAGRLTFAATMKGSARRFIRNAVLSTADKLPAARRKLAMDLSGLGRHRGSVSPGINPSSEMS